MSSLVDSRWVGSGRSRGSRYIRRHRRRRPHCSCPRVRWPEFRRKTTTTTTTTGSVYGDIIYTYLYSYAYRVFLRIRNARYYIYTRTNVVIHERRRGPSRIFGRSTSIRIVSVANRRTGDVKFDHRILLRAYRNRYTRKRAQTRSTCAFKLPSFVSPKFPSAWDACNRFSTESSCRLWSRVPCVCLVRCFWQNIRQRNQATSVSSPCRVNGPKNEFCPWSFGFFKNRSDVFRVSISIFNLPCTFSVSYGFTYEQKRFERAIYRI